MYKQQGFTLIEVMIAAFVLAVGMLGSTAMMLRGMQQADNVNYETVAFQLAVNMSERMRSNITGVAAGDYDNLVADDSATMNCSAAACNTSDVAAYHAYIWGQELVDLLPYANPTATVTAVNPLTPDTVFSITVSWDRDKRVDTTTRTASTETYTMIFQP